MKCSFEIDYLKKTTDIDRCLPTFSTEYSRKKVLIDRILNTISIEKKKKTYVLISYKGAIVKIYIPINTNWVWLQNRFLPTNGQYLLD